MRIERRHPATLVIGTLLLTGCSAKVGPKDGAVDQARKVAELEREVERLTIEVEEARADLEAVASNGSEAVDLAVLPRPHALLTASGSAVRRGDDGAELRWRLRSEDLRGRFLQTSGPVLLEAVAIGDRGEAIELGRWEIDAQRWREGLREGFMGTAYAIDVPLNGDLPSQSGSILARVSVSDVRLESPLQLESEIPVIDLESRRGEK